MELYTIPIADDSAEEKLILYRPLLGVACVGNQSMANLLQRMATGTDAASLDSSEQSAAAFLEEIGFLKPDPPAPVEQPGFRPSMAVLMLTNRCQLRCIYCYAGAGDQPEQGLSYESGKAVIDRVFGYAQENNQKMFEVYFHGGGEPTYHWDVLQRLTQYARSKPIPASLSLTSNAMWSPSQLDWIVSNMDGLGISMDGSPQTQNTQRPVKSGQHSSPVVMTNLAELDRRGVQYGIRITALPPFTSLPQDVLFICKTMACNQIIQVEPAYNEVRGSISHPGEDQAAQFVQAFIEAYDIARSHGRRLYYSGARPDVVSTRYCNSPFEALIITPDDRLVSCYEVVGAQHPLAELSTMGWLQNNQPVLDDARRAHLHALLQKRRTACRSCYAYWSCAGDCYTRAFLQGIDHLGEESLRCQVNRTLTQLLLLDLIEEGGGIWRRQSPEVRQFIAEERC